MDPLEGIGEYAYSLSCEELMIQLITPLCLNAKYVAGGAS